MDFDIEDFKQNMKRKKRVCEKKDDKIKSIINDKLFYLFTKFLICIILTLVTLIVTYKNNKLKSLLYEKVYDTNFSFATINKLYKSYFGSPLPFKDLFSDKIAPTFNEKLSYYSKEKYLDGEKLVVDDNYLIPILESGMVVFIGEKEGYGNTIIVQQVNGVDVWYSNIGESSVKMHDYIEKGSLLGETKGDILYLVFKKDGNVLDPEDYI